jgi:hypothetical protein
VAVPVGLADSIKLSMTVSSTHLRMNSLLAAKCSVRSFAPIAKSPRETPAPINGCSQRRWLLTECSLGCRHCPPIVQESSVFVPVGLLLSEKQIPRFVGNVSNDGWSRWSRVVCAQGGRRTRLCFVVDTYLERRPNKLEVAKASNRRS